ncbi:MAG TPA: hypothetical protein VHO67_14850 [Polyangia bacterium]|nr:hypothetical protein [Polyangia bacterium]
MTPRGRTWRVALLLASASGLAAGCGGGANSAGTGGTSGRDASFAVCSGTPAVPFTPGLSALSASGAYRVTIQDATATDATGATTPGAGIGHDTFTVAVGPAADGGVAAPIDGMTMGVPSIPGEVPADPYMPVHKHGGATIPAVAAQGGGVFAVSGIDFFMSGYWELYLALQARGAATADRVTFSICIPAD